MYWKVGDETSTEDGGRGNTFMEDVEIVGFAGLTKILVRLAVRSVG